MNLDVNKIYHQYIVRMVIFSLFLFKRQIRQPSIFNLSVNSFIKRRLPWKINLIIDTGFRVDKEEERDIFLDQLLNDVETDYLSDITVTFTTPLKSVTMKVDLRNESKYEKYLYD